MIAKTDKGTRLYAQEVKKTDVKQINTIIIR